MMRWRDIPVERRRIIADRISLQDPNKIPVILEKHVNTDLDPTKEKFILPLDEMCWKLCHLLSQYISVSAYHSVILFIGPHVISTSQKSLRYFIEYVSKEDHVLHIRYLRENTFG